MTRPAEPIAWRAWSLCKRGNQSDEYEDAFAANPEAGRFAVADGASESSFAGLWARLLVEGYTRRLEKTAGVPSWIAGLGRRWAQEVDHRPLPWYAEEKRQQGAFAAFLGLRLTQGRWRTLAVGDSCLFQVRDGELLRTFPLTSSASFGNQPSLLGSRSTVAAKPLKARGEWRPGDRFLLMTDALAQWFLQQMEAGKQPATQIENDLDLAKSESIFATWIEDLRERHALRNDDVTLVSVQV
jgi:hypothetical protein